MRNCSRSQHDKTAKALVSILIALMLVFTTACQSDEPVEESASMTGDQVEELYSLEYDGEIAVEINNNVPDFTSEEKDEAAEKVFEEYSELDSLGRCGIARATVCMEIMPPEGEKRTSLGSVTPSGWQKINFWSRCHLIGYQLAGENANEKNLITGTSRMNVSGMLPYENEIDDYIEDNLDNHVLYEVEPIFEGDNLVASGVHMQAWSVEDNGSGVSFNVYVFNYQPGYIVNYQDGTVDDDPDHQTVITIEDKEGKWTGEPVEVDDAVVEGSTGAVRYIYYTESECHVRTTIADGAFKDGGAPTNRGTYYAKAVVLGDNWYPTAASNTAKLVIK